MPAMAVQGGDPLIPTVRHREMRVTCDYSMYVAVTNFGMPSASMS